MEALILVATSCRPTMFARIGVMRALNRHVERVFNPEKKEAGERPSRPVQRINGGLRTLRRHPPTLEQEGLQRGSIG